MFRGRECNIAPMTEMANPGAGTGNLLRQTLPYRLKAAGIHLGLSFVVFAVALYLILVRWYPGFHFAVDGGWQGVRIMAAVDLVLGPTLTLVVFNPFKARRLIAFDLGCIGLAQLAALAWGFYAIHKEHPVVVACEDGTCHSVIAEPLAVEKFGEKELARLSDRRPGLVYVAPPANGDETTRAAVQELVGGVKSYEDPFFYRPFAEHWNELKAKATVQDGRVLLPYEGRYGSCKLAFTPEGEFVGAQDCEKS